MKIVKQCLALGLFGLISVQSVSACAQSASGAEAQMPMSPEMMRERVMRRQAELHDKLKISAAQEAAWKVYAQAMEPDMAPRLHEDVDLDKLTTIERMQRSLDKIREHETKMQGKLNATKTFFGVLNAEQKKQFEEYHRKMRKEMQEKMARQMQRKEGMMFDKP